MNLNGPTIRAFFASRIHAQRARGDCVGCVSWHSSDISIDAQGSRLAKITVHVCVAPFATVTISTKLPLRLFRAFASFMDCGEQLLCA
ncbi:hypothetical protein CBOM_07988 [Ceraceosorus bombacis]|uniref:Uncharacterized protein n=1 Tax=Ceraceosorus bombacis TaxID=401625 RepID=A0A0P1BJZ2_9BASI|nr:hypothetical protein CBOM_07988 [Ceraceosorus bombacis]